MTPPIDLQLLLAAIGQRSVDQPIPTTCRCAVDDPEAESTPHYHNLNAELGIDFRVTRLPLAGLQVLDPRLVRIAPGARNECHRHGHESIFVVLSGQGELRLGNQTVALKAGDVASVPRWVVHQSRNTSSDAELLLLAITDFGLTSAVLGDYDRNTRLKVGGADAFPAAATAAAQNS